MIAPRQPLTIEDRVELRDVDVTVHIEKDKIDEFVQELQGIVTTLHAEVVWIRVVDRESRKR